MAEFCAYFKNLTDLVKTEGTKEQKEYYEKVNTLCSKRLVLIANLAYWENQKDNTAKTEDIIKGERLLNLISSSGMPYANYYFAYKVYMPEGNPTKALESARKARDLGYNDPAVHSLIKALASDNPYNAFKEWKRRMNIE